MKSYKTEFKGYSRKGIIKNTEWNFVLFKVTDIMKTEYKIKKMFKSIKFILKSCAKAAYGFASKLVDIDGVDNYNAKKVKYNNYENCRIEISLQMLIDRNIF